MYWIYYYIYNIYYTGKIETSLYCCEILFTKFQSKMIVYIFLIIIKNYAPELNYNAKSIKSASSQYIFLM